MTLTAQMFSTTKWSPATNHGNYERARQNLAHSAAGDEGLRPSWQWEIFQIRASLLTWAVRQPRQPGLFLKFCASSSSTLLYKLVWLWRRNVKKHRVCLVNKPFLAKINGLCSARLCEHIWKGLHCRNEFDSRVDPVQAECLTHCSQLLFSMFRGSFC